MQAVSAMDAADARARAALRLAEEADARAEEAEKRAAGLVSALERAKVPQAPVLPSGHVVTVTADAVTVQRKGKKFVIPFALVSILAPLIWAGVTDYLETKRQAKEMKDTFADTTARIDKLEQKLAEQARDNASLRETVAQLSGYLAGIFPKAGLMVPGAMPGAAPVNVVSDPLPIGARRMTPVMVRTAVPAPAPK